MTHISKLLLGAAAIALLGGCGMFSKSDSASSSSSSRTASSSTTPSDNAAPMTKTAPVDGGSPASVDPGIGQTRTGGANAAGIAQENPAPAAGGIKLSEVKNPKATLANATVKDSKGEAVGEVKSVKVAGSGKLTSIRVAVGTRIVALKLSTLTYDQAENTITSQQSKAEIQKIR